MATEDIYLPEGDFQNPLLKQQGFGLLKPSTGSTFEAGLELGKMDAPMNYLEDLNKYNKAEESSTKLSPEDANKQYGIPNYLNFDREISPDAARVIQERTYKRIGLEDRLNRASSAQSIAGLGGQFIGQMFDPINLGASFIPVTKIPGASSLIAGLALGNPFARRATVGAIEGIVGQAVIEPIYMAGDYLDFEEHTATDVLRNLAFGAAFGSGAHIVFGGVYDGAKFLYGKTKSTHQNAAVTAINQMLDGGIVDVEPILRADPEFGRTEALRNELANIEATGNYSGPQSYNYFESYPTGLGTEGPLIRSPGDPIISGNIPTRTKQFDILDLSGDLTPANLGGSNKAYVAQSDSGPMYVKLQKSGPEPINQNRVKSEMLANNLYQLFGDNLIVPANLVRVNGELGVATPFYDGAQKVDVSELSEKFFDLGTPPEQREQIRSIIVNSVLDMFLGNHDAFAFGNIIKVNDQYKKIDQGGALLYRAMGEKKAEFGAKIKELTSMTDPVTAPDAGPFLQEVLSRKLLDEGVEKILSTDLSKIVDSVLAAKFTKNEENEILGALATRYTTLANMFPDIAKKAAAKLNKLSIADTQSAYKMVVDQSRAFNKKIAKLPEDERHSILEAIGLYQGSGYSHVNGYLRQTGPYNQEGLSGFSLKLKSPDYIENQIKLLDKASEFGKLDKAATVYRWIPAQTFHPNIDQGFMSTSLFAERSPFHVDENYANNLLVVVHAPEGTKGFWPDAHDMASDKRALNGSFSVPEAGEYEFVIGRGQKYEIMAPATDKVSIKGREYKEIHIRLLGKEPAQNLRPLTLKELAAGATAYHNQPSAAADPEVFLPPEAVTFNSVVEKLPKLGEKYSNPEMEQMIADLEASAKMVMTPEEIKATLESFDQAIKDVDDYIGGLNQAFVCWKNG